MNYTERNRLMDKLCGIGLMVIFVLVFFSIITGCLTGNFGMSFVAHMPLIVNVISGIFLLIGIVILVLAYRKENYWRAGYGIEFIVLAFATLFLMHAFIDLPAPLSQLKWKIIIPAVFAIYYLIKSIYVIIKANKRGK